MFEDPPKLNTDIIELEKIHFGIQQYVGAQMLHDLKMEMREDFITGNIILNIRGAVLGKEMNSSTSEETEHHPPIPFTWWDAVKDRFFPVWLLSRFPVRMRQLECLKIVTEKHYHVCPHLNTVSEREHIRWFVPKEGD